MFSCVVGLLYIVYHSSQLCNLCDLHCMGQLADPFPPQSLAQVTDKPGLASHLLGYLADLHPPFAATAPATLTSVLS